MSNPFSFIEDLRQMNDTMVSRLDGIIQRLDLLLALEQGHQEKDASVLQEFLSRMSYGDGK